MGPHAGSLADVPEPLSPRHAAFGAAVRERRNELEISQEDAADATRMDRTYYSGIERGLRNPSLAVLYRLADGLRTTLADLARRADDR